MTSESKPFARLPTHVIPLKYHLEFSVDLEKDRFEVIEAIDLSIKKDTNTITAHAVDLYVFNVSVEYYENGVKSSIKCETMHQHLKDQSIEFIFPTKIPSSSSNIQLKLQCHGTLNDDLRGFYRSEYDYNCQLSTSVDQMEKRVMAVTQFEACDARRAFVCWDEPAVKATFAITIVTDPMLTAISNTHVVQTTLRPTKRAHIRSISSKPKIEKVWVFAESPKMSTYLMGMIIGEFDIVTDVTKEGVLVSVYTPVGRSNRGLFALDVGTKALSYFSQRFGIPYPLKKLDMLAIPDFAAGAMENWGVVTYRETRLLIDANLSSFGQKLATARTVCHELAHQWFGNLVTMEWWTGLWLNEGFARFMEFEALNHIFPEWCSWDFFVQEITMATAMVKDAMHTSHPIEVVVNHPDEVDQIFDIISYAKGASIIRMLSEHLGREIFYKGIHEYLIKFSYANATTEDLWQSLESASGQNITAMARTWTNQTGYPVLTITNEGSIVQNRFLTTQTSILDKSRWHIPLSYISSSDPNIVHRVGIWSCDSTSSGAAPSEIIAALPLSDKWIKINPNQSGFYLVNYSQAGWTALQDPVEKLVLSVVDRMSLLNSMFALTRSGIVSIDQALDFTRAYVEEPEYLCWKEISASLSYYCTLFKEEDFFPILQKYLRSLYTKVMDRLTWNPSNDELETTAHFRRDVISMLGRADEESVLKKSACLFDAYLSDGASPSLPADLRTVVFNIQARRGDRSHMEKLRSCYEKSNFIEEKLNCLAAMGLVPDLAVKQEVIDWALQNVRSQDIQYAFSSVSASLAGAEATWTYLQNHWEQLNNQYAPYIVGRILSSVISRFQTTEKAIEIENFMKDRKNASYERVLDAALERIRIKSSVYGRDRECMRKWLIENVKE